MFYLYLYIEVFTFYWWDINITFFEVQNWSKITISYPAGIHTNLDCLPQCIAFRITQKRHKFALQFLKNALYIIFIFGC